MAGSRSTGIPAPSGTGTMLLLAALLAAAHVAALVLQWADAFRPNIAAMIAESVVYVLAVLLLFRHRATAPLWFILLVAAFLRLSILPFETYHSTDIFRYLWDGRVQGAGINPYLYVPNDPALASLRDGAIWPNINRGDYATTLYPPAAEMIFFLATRAGQSVVWLKVVLVAIEAVGIWGIVRLLDADGLPRERVLAYAWCPVPVWEIAGAGHIDGAMTTFTILALLAARRGHAMASGAALGVAVLVKFFPLLLIPALWRRWDWRLPAALAATIVAGYLPYLGAGRAMFGFMAGYAGEEGLSDGSGFWILHVLRAVTGWPIPTLAYVGAVAAVLGVLAIGVTRTDTPRVRLYAGGLALAAAAVGALSPIYPWYYIWLVPFLCFVPAEPILWVLGTLFLFYWDQPRLAPWLIDIVYGGATLVALGLLTRFVARGEWRLRRGKPA